MPTADSWLERLRQGLRRNSRRPTAAPAAGDHFFVDAIALSILAGLWLHAAGGYHAGFLRLNSAAAALPEWLWQGLTIMGDERFAFAFMLIFAARFPQVFWAAIAAAVIGALYSRGLKIAVDTLRPPAVLSEDVFNLIGNGYRRSSFPSGHTLTAFLIAGIWCSFLPRWRVLLVLAASLIAFSRVVVGVHWPVDLFAGAGGGLLAAWIGAHLAARWHWGLRPLPHLLFVGLALVASVSLLIDDAGYHASGWIRIPVAALALTVAAWSYLLLHGALDSGRAPVKTMAR